MEVDETKEAESLPTLGKVKAGRGRPSGSRSRNALLEPTAPETEVSNSIPAEDKELSGNGAEPKSRINGRATRTGRADRSNPSKINVDKPIFTLSVAADILGLHPRTLRIYEEHGLVVPHRTQTQRRRYSQNDIKKFQFIQFLTRDRGVNLNGVKIILQMLEELRKTLPEPVRYIFPDYQQAD
ncbi:MAG: MerR family transcriptional regulator [Chloroflexota bacterium]|nr:MerR family transcriptional regulator [Chloroflexota bacterium]